MNTTPSTPKPTRDRSLHLQCVCTFLVALGTAYVSYRHGREFATRFGADATTATLWPLIVDGLLILSIHRDLYERCVLTEKSAPVLGK